jgi:iron(III) transport system substrate-binding protein
VVYSGRSESLVGPLFDQAQEVTGLDLQVQYGDTAELVTRFMAEGMESPADLVFAQDSGHLGVLGERELLAALPTALLEMADPGFRDPGGRWVGVSGRLRVLVYNTEAVPAEKMPATLAELVNPAWAGRLGWAPMNSSFQAHISALRVLWGEQKTREWLTALAALEPTRYPKNAPQIAATAKGEIAIGWVNHYYLHRKKTPGFAAANHSFPTPHDAGNIMMVSGIGVRAGSPRAAQAQALVEFLLGEEAQTTLAQEVYEYPARPGIPTHPEVPPLESVSLATVDQSALTDLGPTRALLRDLGLL